MARYIDADKLIEHIKDLPTWWEDEGGVYGHSMKYPEGLFHCEDVINSIENAPTADVVEVKHGHWNDNIVQLTTVAGVKEDFVLGYKCSLCGRTEMLKEPYCNCGAKMDVPDTNVGEKGDAYDRI